MYESGDVDNNPTWLNILRTVFRYRVDMATGNIDWNRDGTFQPPNVPVRAYANFRPYDSGGCEFTREGEVKLPVKSHPSPAVIRYNGLIWVFTVSDDNKLEYSYTPSAWTCPNVDDCPAPEFPYHAVHDIGPVDAVDAAAINVNGNWVVIIVSIRPDGSLVETWMHMDGWQIVWESTVDVPGSPAGGEPSLAVSPSGTSVSLVYKGTDNVVRYRSRTTATWRPEEVVTVGSTPLPERRVASRVLWDGDLPSTRRRHRQLGLQQQERLDGAGLGFMLGPLGGPANRDEDCLQPEAVLSVTRLPGDFEPRVMGALRRAAFSDSTL